jgi:DNA-directed RNA polymerase beta subunit
MIERQKEKYQWEFIFLGANIDAIKTASDFGISHDRVANYHSDERGTALNYDVISETVREFRMQKSINPDWNKKINEDFKNRKSNIELCYNKYTIKRRRETSSMTLQQPSLCKVLKLERWGHDTYLVMGFLFGRKEEKK